MKLVAVLVLLVSFQHLDACMSFARKVRSHARYLCHKPHHFELRPHFRSGLTRGLSCMVISIWPNDNRKKRSMDDDEMETNLLQINLEISKEFATNIFHNNESLVSVHMVDVSDGSLDVAVMDVKPFQKDDSISDRRRRELPERWLHIEYEDDDDATKEDDDAPLKDYAGWSFFWPTAVQKYEGQYEISDEATALLRLKRAIKKGGTKGGGVKTGPAPTPKTTKTTTTTTNPTTRPTTSSTTTTTTKPSTTTSKRPTTSTSTEVNVGGKSTVKPVPKNSTKPVENKSSNATLETTVGQNVTSLGNDGTPKNVSLGSSKNDPTKNATKGELGSDVGTQLNTADDIGNAPDASNVATSLGSGQDGKDNSDSGPEKTTSKPPPADAGSSTRKPFPEKPNSGGKPSGPNFKLPPPDIVQATIFARMMEILVGIGTAIVAFFSVWCCVCKAAKKVNTVCEICSCCCCCCCCGKEDDDAPQPRRNGRVETMEI